MHRAIAADDIRDDLARCRMTDNFCWNLTLCQKETQTVGDHVGQFIAFVDLHGAGYIEQEGGYRFLLFLRLFDQAHFGWVADGVDDFLSQMTEHDSAFVRWHPAHDGFLRARLLG